MQFRRAALALSLVTALPSLAGSSLAFAQTDVGDAESRADEAGQAKQDAYRLVSGAVADRDRIEGQLFEALVSYQLAADELSAASAKLTRIEQKMSNALARSAQLEDTFESAAINAYMVAVGGGSHMFLAGTESSDFLFASQVLDNVQGNTQADIDRVAAIRSELNRLQADYLLERDAVAGRTSDLDARAGDLEILFAQADAAVSSAYSDAKRAEAAYIQALSGVDAARAAQEVVKRQEQSTTTTSTSTTTAAGGGEAPVEPEPPKPVVTVKPTTESWRGLVAAHFPPSRVDEALVIIQCESNGDPAAINPYSGAAGLFQFLPGTWAAASVSAGVGSRSVFDAEANVIAAAWLSGYYQSRGYDPWQPWSCRHHLS